MTPADEPVTAAVEVVTSMGAIMDEAAEEASLALRVLMSVVALGLVVWVMQRFLRDTEQFAEEAKGTG